MKLVLAVSTLIAVTVLVPSANERSRPSNELPKWTKFDVILTGEDATRWVAELLKTRPRFAAAQAQSRIRLAARGYRTTGEIVVYKVQRRPEARHASSLQGSTSLPSVWAKLAGFFAPRISAQTQEQASNEGYAIFTSWDDGNGGTWEGNMYFIDEVEPIDTNIDGQLDITQEQPPPVIWATGEMAGPHGGPHPINFEEPLRSVFRFERASGAHGLSTLQNRCACGMRELAKCFVRNGWDDAWPFCIGEAAFCRWSGPLWFNCTAGACGATFVGATILVGREYWRACVRAPSPNLAGVSYHADSSSTAVCGGLRLHGGARVRAF